MSRAATVEEYRFGLPRLYAQDSTAAQNAIDFCLSCCNHKTNIHDPDCLSWLWNSRGRLVVPAEEGPCRPADIAKPEGESKPNDN